MPEKRDICILLLSPLNPFFSEENIGRLVEFAHKEHANSQVIFMIPDVPLYQNFLALGYPLRIQPESNGVKNDDLAESRARKYVNQLRNKVNRVAPEIPVLTFNENVLIPDAEGNKNFFGPKRQYWCDMRNLIAQLNQTNDEFCKDSLETSRPVLQTYASHFKKEVLPENKPDYLACCYLWDELAAFAVMPDLLQDAFGIPKTTIGEIVCVYPKTLPLFKKFFDGKYNVPTSAKIKFQQPSIPQ